MVGTKSKPHERVLAVEGLLLGRSARQVARETGRCEKTVRLWAKFAGVRMTDGCWDRVPVVAGPVAARPRGRGVRLDEHDRIRIEVLLREGLCPAQIARELGVHRATIGRELSEKNENGKYLASAAQRKTEEARVRPKTPKLAPGRLRDTVVELLNQRFSPRQISAHLHLNYPDDDEMNVSHETIYQALYVQTRGALREELKVDKALRSGRKQRIPRSRLPKKTTRTWLEGHHISTRPAEADDRSVPGHWEGDLVLGANNKTALITLVERSTRFALIRRLPLDHGSTTVVNHLIDMISHLPEHLLRSLTWDQGSEMAEHARFTLASDVQVYFCDPHSPWQRGTNENTNGLIRDFWPKGTDFSLVTDDQIANTQYLLNIRPRATLNWKTPAKALEELMLQ